MQKGREMLAAWCVCTVDGVGLSEPLNMYSRLNTAGEMEILIYLFILSECKAGLDRGKSKYYEMN